MKIKTIFIGLLMLCLLDTAFGDKASLASAIKDLMTTYGDDYPRGAEFLARLRTAEGQAFENLEREALLANPLVSDRPIVFVSRSQYRSDHHNTATMFQTGEINTRSYRGGGKLKMLDVKSGKVTTLLDPGPEANIRDLEVSFDGRRFLFALRRDVKQDYHIFECSADGSGLRQLTAQPGVFDIDPVYLPGGDIIFTSSREPKYCMCNRHIMGNLFRMEGDGANIHQIGKSTLHEGHPCVMPDGRILYDRWEYVDRNFGDAQGLWVVNPDGTNHAIYWGNNTNSPGGVIDGRIIPGTQQCICIFTSCHDRPWGALAIIDPSQGIDGRDGVVRTWPASAIDLVGRGNFDMFQRVRPRYEDPYPLNDKYFLAVREVGKECMAICLLDMFGNEILVHQENPGCYDPIPLAPRPEAPRRSVARDYSNDTGTFYVQNVYIGTHMTGVERGSVKALRVIESPEKRNWTHPSWGGQGVHCPGMNWHNFENKRILGTVPVEKDGSACFEAPSDTFLFFQLLDADGMMVQSMRSGTIIQSGETQSCVGCHEDRVAETPELKDYTSSLALKRPPSRLTGWHGHKEIFSFQRDVQPVFDRHCVSCHDVGKKAGEKLRLCGDRAVCFNASYIDLWSLGFIKCVGGGPHVTQPPRSWGSHASKLTSVIRGTHPKHKKLKLTREEKDRVITWMDMNAPYYPFYESAYPGNPTGRCPVSNAKLKRLSQLTGARYVMRHGGNQRAAVFFDRPEKSPCLAKLDRASPEYKEALAIIQEGKDNLAKLPRADMPGFVPCETDRLRIAKYEALQDQEQANRAAIRTGKKSYDPGIAPKP